MAHIESARQVAFLWIGAAANSVVGVAATLETHGIAIATARRTGDRMRHPTAMRPVIFGWMEQKYG